MAANRSFLFLFARFLSLKWKADQNSVIINHAFRKIEIKWGRNFEKNDEGASGVLICCCIYFAFG